MPLFDYRCPQGHLTTDQFHPITESVSAIPCPQCTELARKVLSFPAIRKGLQPHFNHSVGRYVQSDADLRAAFSEKSDAMSRQTGIDHNYVPLDHQEAREVCGVTDEGLDSTRRRQVDSGETSVQNYF